MSYDEGPTFFEDELEALIEEEETNKADFEERNPTLDYEETWDFDYAYKMYLKHTKSLLNGLRTEKYRNPREAIEHVIQNDYQLNNDYVKFMRKMVEDSVKMRVKIEELEERIEELGELEERIEKVEERQLEQRLINLRQNGGSHKSNRNRKTIKNKSRK